MSAYHSNDEVRKEIDDVLHENAMIFQNIGTDSHISERFIAKDKEISNLESVRDLDEEFIDGILHGIK